MKEKSIILIGCPALLGVCVLTEVGVCEEGQDHRMYDDVQLQNSSPTDLI